MYTRILKPLAAGAIAFLVTILSLSSCNTEKYPEPDFVTPDAALTLRGKVIMSYDELNHQFAVNPVNGEYRQFNDIHSEWFILKLKSFPTEDGQKVKGSLRWKTAKGEKEYKNVEFRAVNVDGEGETKLWDSHDGIGVVMQRTR